MKFLRSLSCKRYRPWNFPVMIYFLQNCVTHDKLSHFKGDISWSWANEEISSEVHRVKAFNSMNLWWNFFVLYVSRDIALEMSFFVCFTFLQKKIMTGKFQGRYLLQLRERRNFIRGSQSWRLQLYEPLTKFLRLLIIKRNLHREKYF